MEIQSDSQINVKPFSEADKAACGRYAKIKERLLNRARQDKAVQAVIAFGSSTRMSAPADCFSDLDLMVVTEAPAQWLADDVPQAFGPVSMAFAEPTFAGGQEWRLLYGADLNLDLMVFSPDQFAEAVETGFAGDMLRRGYRVLYDTCGLTEVAEQAAGETVHQPEMTERAFLRLTNDFYFHIIWAAKKLLQGELWSAAMNINGYQKKNLLRMIETYTRLTQGCDTWHDGRFVDRWADESIRTALRGCFARYNAGDIAAAIRATHMLFARLAKSVAETQGFRYPSDAEQCAAAYLDAHF